MIKLTLGNQLSFSCLDLMKGMTSTIEQFVQSLALLVQDLRWCAYLRITNRADL